MIYSIIPFLNETHFLDIKLQEEIEFVDKIILIEANQRYNGKTKEFILKNNSKYSHPKIEILFLENQLTPYKSDSNADVINETAWDNERIQRNAAMREFNDDDIIIYTDCDEIFRRDELPKIVDEAIKAEKKTDFIRMCQKHYVYKINLLLNSSTPWYGPICITGKILKELIAYNEKNSQQYKLDFNLIRRLGYGTKIPTEGKHFNYVMSPEDISYKLKSFSHTELDKPEFTGIENIKKRLYEKKDVIRRRDQEGYPISIQKVPIDKSYPISILENMKFWGKYIEN